MNRIAGLAALLAVALPFPVTANADTFLATSFSVNGAVNVPMSSPLVQTVQAGQVQLNGPGGSLLVFCLDLIDRINLPYLYNVATYNIATPGAFPGIQALNGSQVRQIASLIFNGIDVSDSLSRAATQLAIWKVEYGALFNPVGLSAALQTDMNNKIAFSVLGGLLDCPGCTLRVLTDAPIVASQAFGYAVNNVPLPGAVWLFGSGLVGLIAMGRKKAKRA